ncbi:MAG TPA: D-aminoacyl-tRNA deacylase [Candidatus Pacearchaeota archaeon]|nr:D-aminoacyl-tRNA deacylase [Candidatus Pacearchaeota archaeon]
MYQKYLIIASKKDLAGMNITKNLEQFRENPLMASMKNAPSYDFYFVENETIFTENLDLEKINKYDFVIFASKHESEQKEKTLSVHIPGNWRNAEHGGTKGKVCLSSAVFQKQIFEKLAKNAKEHGIDDKYKLTLEATHHGPLISKPCIFIEIGSTANEWNDRRAAFVVAKTIDEIVKEFRPNPYSEIAIAIGGPHYCPSFNQIQLKSNVAISHVIPKYSLPITEEMINEAIEKTEEELDFVIIDWKGVGISEERQRIIEILDKKYLAWKKTGDISK